MSETISEIRMRAWKTRREKYGKRGHHGSYARSAGQTSDAERMRYWLIALHVDGILSEGQAARATGLHRIALREIADEIANGADNTALFLRAKFAFPVVKEQL